MDLNSPDLVEDMGLPPKKLYHYTTPAGLFGIIESGCRLHATHHRFLNDTGELEFGFRTARKLLDRMPGLDPEARRRTLDEIAARQKDESFLACLSRRHDILSQWRAYANNGTGYCIGFAPEGRLQGDHYDEDHFWRNHLMECLYGQRKLEERLQDRFEKKFERFVGKKHALDFLPEELSHVALRYAQLAKHKHFAEEREWRVVVAEPDREVQYKVGARGLTPYLMTAPLPIVEVWIGPSVGPARDVARRAVRGFLERHKLEAQVEYWKSPFRGP